MDDSKISFPTLQLASSLEMKNAMSKQHLQLSVHCTIVAECFLATEGLELVVTKEAKKVYMLTPTSTLSIQDIKGETALPSILLILSTI